MKKLSILFAFLLCFCFAQPMVSALTVSAQYACVLDAQTGRVIFEKNSRERHSMASTTKIMTALTALENSSLDDMITVGKNAAGTEGTSLYLKAGDKVTLRDLLYGLMLQSGNDAAIAIAEHVAGSVDEFAALMTSRAKTIGAKNTSFKNPNGLDEDGHYTTAYDLALITREALKNETFAEIVATKSKTIRDGTQTITNHNKLLNIYPGCVGVKTGFTKKTGRCLVSSAKRDGKQMVAVTLNAPNDWNDHTNMLNYAFENTVRFPLIAAGMTVNSVTVKNGTSQTLELTAERDFYLSESPDTKFKNARLSCKLPDSITAPVTKGEVIGALEIYYQDTLLDTINLIAVADVGFKQAEKDDLFLKYFKKLLLSGCTKVKFGV